MSPRPPRLELYADDELREQIKQVAKKSKLSVSSWLKLAALRALDEYWERKEKGKWPMEMYLVFYYQGEQKVIVSLFSSKQRAHDYIRIADIDGHIEKVKVSITD